MKNAKNTVLIAALLIIITVACGCSMDPKTMEGEWKAVKITVFDQVIEGEQLKQDYGDITYVFEAGGKVICTLQDIITEGTWSVSGNKVTINANGQTNSAEVADNRFSMGEGADLAITFEKQ